MDINVYIVWISQYNSDEVPYSGDECIVGAYTDELTALKVGCLKQVKIYNNTTEFDGDSPIKDWLEENTFPSVGDDLQTWKNYFEILTDDETIEYVYNVSRLKDTDHDVVHVTRVTLDSVPTLRINL